MNQSPFDFNAPSWDEIKIQGAVWGPSTGGGYVRIEGVDRCYRIHQKDAAGQDGATITYRGLKPIPFRIEFFMWTTAHWNLWQLYSFGFNYTLLKTGVPLVAYDVYHPSLAPIGITSITIDKVGSVVVDPNTKMGKAVLTVRQYIPTVPLPATSTPVSAAAVPPKLAGFTPSPAYLAAQQEITALKLKLASLPSSFPR
jgi:hypothetical protein